MSNVRPEKTFLFFDTCTPLDDVTPWCYTRTEVFKGSLNKSVDGLEWTILENTYKAGFSRSTDNFEFWGLTRTPK